jgi:hypothetical protein
MPEVQTDEIAENASALRRACIRMTSEVWTPKADGERIEATKGRELSEIAHRIFATLKESQIREGTYDYEEIAELTGQLSDSAEELEHPEIEGLVVAICSSVLQLKIYGAKLND